MPWRGKVNLFLQKKTEEWQGRDGKSLKNVGAFFRL